MMAARLDGGEPPAAAPTPSKPRAPKPAAEPAPPVMRAPTQAEMDKAIGDFFRTGVTIVAEEAIEAYARETGDRAEESRDGLFGMTASAPLSAMA